MATPPTFILDNEGASWDTSTNPKTTAAFDSAVGNVWVAGGISESEIETFSTPTNTGTAQAYTARGNVDTTDYSEVRTWTAIVSAVLTAQTVSIDRTAGSSRYGINVVRFSGSDGIGAVPAGQAETDGTAPSLDITTTGDNSAIVVFVGDWNAADGASRTWRTVNSITPTAGNGFELTYFRNSSFYTVYVGYYPDAGAAGVKTVGLSAPTTMKAAIVAVEVKGTAAAAAGGAGLANIPWTRGPGVSVLPLPPWFLPTPYAGELGVAAQVEASTGEGQLGLSAEATAKHVGRPSGSGHIGLSGDVTAKHVGTPTGRGNIGVSSQATTKKVAVVTANCSLGLAGIATAKKVATTTGRGQIGLSANFSHVQIAVVTANCSLGLAGVATAKHVGTPTASGHVGFAGIATAKHVGKATGNSSAGLVGLATAKKVSTVLANCALRGGIAGQATVKKVATPSALSSLGLTAWANRNTRAITAIGSIGLTSLCTAQKRSTPLLSGHIGLLGRNTGVTKKATGDTANSSLAFSPHAVAATKRPATARAFIPLGAHAIFTPAAQIIGILTGGHRDAVDMTGGQHAATEITGGQRPAANVTGGTRQ